MILRGGVKTIPIITGGYNKKSQRGGPVYFNELVMPHTNAYSFVETPGSAFSPVYTFIDYTQDVILMKVQTNGDAMSGLRLVPNSMVQLGSGLYPLAPQSIGQDGLHPKIAQKTMSSFMQINVGAWPDFTNMYLYAYNSVSTDLEYIGFMPVNAYPQLLYMNYLSPYDVNNALNLGIELRYWEVNQSDYVLFENAFQSCYNNYNNPDKAAMTYYVTATNNYGSYDNAQVNGGTLTAELFSAMTGLSCNSLT